MILASAMGAAMSLAGCAKDSAGTPKLSAPFGRNAREESMRKVVEAGSFPTAKQAGVKSQSE